MRLETGRLRARLAEDSGQVVMLRLEVKQLGEQARRGDSPARRPTIRTPRSGWACPGKSMPRSSPRSGPGSIVSHWSSIPTYFVEAPAVLDGAR